jgi:hydroxymethylglutaryl-CoA lyase
MMSSKPTEAVDIVEVGMRDGLQSIASVVPTDQKIEILKRLYAAGMRRVEATSFVSVAALPQLADAIAVLDVAQSLPGLDAQVLVPTRRYAARALDAGARHLAFVLSTTEKHNQCNVRRSVVESIDEYAAIVTSMPPEVRIRLNIATAFDCPFGGHIDESATLRLLEKLVALKADVEIALCDTTGRATPAQVQSLFASARTAFSGVSAWAFHAHDTYGIGAANVLSAWYGGVRVFDASIAGLGGCPFAPGATGNVATEDLLWMFAGMGIATGIDLQLALGAAHLVAQLPGAQVGGRVRQALSGTLCKLSEVAA